MLVEVDGQSLVNISGIVRDSAELTFPATGREFRGVWQLNGDVVEIDMPTARDIKIEKIYAKALERVAKAEEQAAIDAIANAATSEELDVLNEDTIYA